LNFSCDDNSCFFNGTWYRYSSFQFVIWNHDDFIKKTVVVQFTKTVSVLLFYFLEICIIKNKLKKETL